MKFVKTALTPSIAVISVAIFAVLTAQADVFVTPEGGGDFSGKDWDNAMSSVADAYAAAAVGATKENPGVVHLASGMYRLAASIEMKPYVKVVGDTKGPSIISGDNMSTTARAAFWSKNLCDSTNVSKPGISKTPVWNDDLTFNEPNPDNLEAWYCTWYGNSPCNTQRAFVNTTGNAEDNVFENITFTLFRYGSFQLTSGASGTLTLRNCRFIGDCCNAMTDGASAVGVENGSVDIEGCEFVGCAGCVRLTGSGSSHILSSIFRENCFRTLIDAQNTHQLSVSNCVFRRNWQSNSQRAIIYSASATLGNKIVDCVFSNNFAIGSSYGAVYLGGQTNHVLRCNFIDNKNMDWSYDYSASSHKYVGAAGCACICPNSGKVGEVRECSFVGNVMQLSSASTTDAALISWSTGGLQTYFNCNFSGNTIMSDGTGCAALIHRFNGDLSFVHSSIYGNVYSGSSEKIYPFYSSYSGGNNPSSRFLNSFFEEQGYTGSPIYFLKPSKGAPLMYASVIRGFDSSVFDYTSAGAIVDSYVTTADVADKYIVAADGRMFLQLAATSPYRKLGYPIYEDANGLRWTYYPKTKKWQRMDTWSLNYTPTGIVLDESPLVPDAFGDVRKYGKVSLGPVNAERRGLMLLVR